MYQSDYKDSNIISSAMLKNSLCQSDYTNQII
jgi:hypothetical protein